MKKIYGIFNGLMFAACGFCLISTTSCSKSGQSNVGITSGRTIATVIAAVGLINLIVSFLALRSTSRQSTDKSRTVVIGTLVTGVIVTILSALHLSTTTGGFGTGGGRAGAIVALLLGLIGMSLSGLALTRAGRDV